MEMQLRPKKTDIIYNATKTGAALHADRSFVRLAMGPVGCGKSVLNCYEIFIMATQQAPGDDGIRRSKAAIIRNTYPELKATTIATWQQWFPAHLFGAIKWDSPITHHIRYKDVDLEVVFLALDSPVDVKKLMSFELTYIYINEMQFIPKVLFDTCLQRLNRYPPKRYGAPITFTGLIADTNPPDTDHWIYKLFEENKPDDVQIFKYEPALLKSDVKPIDQKYAVSLDGTYYVNNPDADYANNTPDKDYWLKLVSKYTDDQINVYLLGNYGMVMDGRPVHPEYNDVIHYSSKEIKAIPYYEIGLGWDFGHTPACVIVQMTPLGQLVVLDELYTDDMFLDSFVELVVMPHLNKHYPWWKANYVSIHDPSGTTGSQADGKSCQMILEEAGIKSEAAYSNQATPRRAGIKYFLRRLSNGRPGFVLAPHIKRLRKALMGGFQYARVKSSVDNLYHDKPLKNMYSHTAEAGEYICMHYAGENKLPKQADMPSLNRRSA